MRGAVIGTARITLSAPHDDVTGAAGADTLGNAVTYTCPTTRNIRFGVSGTAALSCIYSKNSGANTVFTNNITLSMANGDTLRIGFDEFATAGTKTITITDTIANVLIDSLVLTVT